MARFTITGSRASFINAGTHKMVLVPCGAPALAREVVEVSRIDDLKPHFARVRAALDEAGTPYSLNVQLVKADRAPRGWKDRRSEFRFDQDFSA